MNHENHDSKKPASLFSRKIPRAGLILLIICLVLWFLLGRNSSPSSVFRTSLVKKGDLQVAITATGTLEPEEVIDVGAQVAGLIVAFGKDRNDKPIDYGSQVEEGTILAQIDDSLYISDVEQAEAALKRAQADLAVARAKLVQAERDWNRIEKVGPSSAISPTSIDSYRAAYEVAKATIGVSEAQVSQTEAALAKSKRNLGYCVIRSPVKGVIIDRRVNIGQTVVSSLNAPSLFLLAKDLRRMQLWASVNEADIGNIRPGQIVSFSVDAFPGQVFTGEVGKIRLNATMTQNVVTYIVEVVTDNSDGKLLPYLTATARFEVTQRKDVLLVPNAAIRWSPKDASLSSGSEKQETNQDNRTIWITEDGETLKPLLVQVGLTDGTNTEISGKDIREEMMVVIGEEENPSGASTGSSSPFAPQIRRGRRA